jgi:hypothetical protein
MSISRLWKATPVGGSSIGGLLDASPLLAHNGPSGLGIIVSRHKSGSGWVLVDLAGLQTRFGALIQSWVGSIPTRSRHFFHC